MGAHLRRCAWVACVLMIGLAAQAPGGEATAQKAALSGRVVNEAGQGVAGAKLTLHAWRDSKQLATAATDDDGRFTIAELPPGCRHLLYVDADGLAREFVEAIDLFPGRTTQLADLRLARGCVCRGQVRDPQGHAGAHLEITVNVYRHELGHSINLIGPAYKIKSDAAGLFATPPLPSGYATFNVTPAAGFVAAPFGPVYIDPWVTPRNLNDIHLVPEVPLEGIVVSQSGQPVILAEVWHTYDLDHPVRTDLLGRFTLHGLSAKTVDKTRVGLEALGYAGYQEREDGGANPRHIVLAPCHFVSGRAVDAETGQPIKLDTVVVCEVRRDADGTPHSHGCGEARFVQPKPGEFRAQVSAGGEKHLTLMADGYDRGEDYVLGAAAEDDSKIVTIKMRRAGSLATAAKQRIRGLVRADGQPAAGVWISLWQKKEEWDPVNAGMQRGRTVDFTYRPWAIDVLTDDGGAYLVDVPDPGAYYLVASPPEGALLSSLPLAITAGQELTCDFDLKPGGTIRGQVSGLPPEQAQRLWVVAFGHVPYCEAVQVDPQGHFLLTGVPAGEIGLKVGYEGHLDADVPRYPFRKEDRDRLSEPWTRALRVHVVDGQTSDNLTLELPPPGPPDGTDE